MKTLLILRHAKSSWKNAGLADHDRPLNKRGERDAPRMGSLLREEMLVPDLIISSSARRARMTVEAVVTESGYSGEVRFSRELYAAGPEAYIETLQALEDGLECVMVVGHNPDLEELLEMLSGEAEILPTAALSQVELDIDHWQDLPIEADNPPGKLVALWRPRELG